MSRRPRLVVPVAAAVIGSVTTFLLFRLSQRPPAPPVVISPTIAVPPAALLPALLPAVDEEGAPPVPWAMASHTGSVSPHWKIAFDCNDAGSERTDLWTANGDGSGVRRVLTDARSPCWSPQRRMLAFARGGNVWVANADGTNARALTFWPAPKSKSDAAAEIHGITWNGHDNILSFSRDAVYHLANETAHWNSGRNGDARSDVDDEGETVRGSTLYHLALKPAKAARATVALPFAPVVNETPMRSTDLDNTETEQTWRRTPPRFDLIEHQGHFNFAENEYPAWSSSGTKMAFVRAGDVWLAEGEAEKNISERGDIQDWSVSRIAASAEYDGHTVGGSHWTVAVTGISWSPDGSWLAYGAERITGSGQNDLHLLRRDKQNDDFWHDTVLKVPGNCPCVSPNGRWILYTFQGTVWAITPDQKKQVALVKPKGQAWFHSAAW